MTVTEDSGAASALPFPLRQSARYPYLPLPLRESAKHPTLPLPLRERVGVRGASNAFTLIELVVVIVILGILAAVALPRFVTFAREARIAKLEAARGAVGTASFLANSMSLTNGLAPSASVTLEGATVTMSLSYPTADTAGIVVAAGLSSKDYSFLNLPSAPANSVAIAAPGGSDVTQCYFLYTSPTVQGNPPDFATVVTTGC